MLAIAIYGIECFRTGEVLVWIYSSFAPPRQPGMLASTGAKTSILLLLIGASAAEEEDNRVL